MDYYDIIEKNLTRSISKKKIEIPADDNASQEDEPSKSNKNKVDRQKLKSKRKSKKTKTRNEKNGGEVIEQKHKECQEETIEEEKQESAPVNKTVNAFPKNEPAQTEEITINENSSLESEPVISLAESPQSTTVSRDELELRAQNKDHEIKLISSKCEPKQEEENIVIEKSPPENEPVVCLAASPQSSTVSDNELKLRVQNKDHENKFISLKIDDDDDFDDLGLKLLNKDDDVDMPSLFVLDDEMEDALNRTFDAGEEVQPGNSSTINAVEQPQKPKPEFESSKGQETVADIKIILTDVQDQNTTILNPSDNTILASSKPKAFKFPTPFKANAKPSLTFSVGTMGNTSSRKTQLAMYNKELEDSCNKRRRSKSFTDLNETRNRTVTFFSPIEVAPIEDIDKRWERLDVSSK